MSATSVDVALTMNAKWPLSPWQTAQRSNCLLQKAVSGFEWARCLVNVFQFALLIFERTNIAALFLAAGLRRSYVHAA